MRRSKQSLRKAKLRDEGHILWKEAVAEEYGAKCESCGLSSGPPHPFFPQGAYAFMRFVVENGVPLCPSCHHRHHFAGDPTIQQRIIKRRGEAWYRALERKSKERPAGSYLTVGWYKEQIERLKSLENVPD